jgi:saccharopine dehydrogenase-like NADP-dependent oxidoreductase
MNVVVLGAGMVGRPMAQDLALDDDIRVTVVDKQAEVLERIAASNPQIAIVNADLSSPQAATAVVSEFDLVLSAVPGYLGFETLKAVITAGKNVVDIAFFPEDPFDLDGLAKDNGVVAVVDCGVAPGMSNVLIGHAERRLDRVDSVLIYVGGLPQIREWPYEYKAGFSPVDVIEEYTRPARYVENGRVVVRPALSDPEFIDFPKIGTLEAFNTDGLRTLAQTIDAPNLKEKTLRYPGHIEKMLVLRETGFFDTEPVEIGGNRIRPIDVTTKLLFPKWKLEPGDGDITVFKVMVEGELAGSPKRYTYEMFDRYDEHTGVHSMARTTGYTATVAVRLLAEQGYTTPGITPPEFLGHNDACVSFLLDGLKQRGVEYKETVEAG